jgi:hypothetical protein
VKRNGQAMVIKLEEFARAGLDIQLDVMEYNDLDGKKAPFPAGSVLCVQTRKKVAQVTVD